MSASSPPPPIGPTRRPSDTQKMDQALIDAELAKMRADTPEPEPAPACQGCDDPACEACHPTTDPPEAA